MAIVSASALIAGVGGTVNLVRNPRCEGAVLGVIGSGGAFPTNWGEAAPASGLSRTIVGSGVDGTTGLPYVDIQFNGTTAVGVANEILLFDTAATPCAPFDQWGCSVYCAIVGGDLTNINSVQLQARAAGAPNFPISPTGTPQRFSFVATSIATPGQVQLGWYFNFATTGVAINVTVRFIGPQLEHAGTVTPLMLPPAGSPGVTNAPLIAAPISYPATTKLAVALIAGSGGGKTNYIRNPRLEGAVVGTPGTRPTFWAVGGDAMGWDIVGIGTEDGISYVDVRFHGTTATTSSFILPEGTVSLGNPRTTPGIVSTLSCYVRLVGGTLANVNRLQLSLQTRNAALAIIDTSNAVFMPTAVDTLGNQRFSATSPPAGATAVTANPVLYAAWNAGTSLPIDFTIRIGGLQQEWGSLSQPPLILPPPGTLAAFTRGIDAGGGVFTTPLLIAAGGGTTNWIDNPNGEGAIVGTTTLPINWSMGNSASGVTVVGAGIDSSTGQDLPYVDLRFNYTATSTQNTLRFEPTTTIPSVPIDVWTQSTYVAVVGGSLANGGVTLSQIVYAMSANGTNVGNAPQVPFTPTATLQRFGAQNRVFPVGVTTVRFAWPVLLFTYTNGAALDFTLRIAGAQLEHGPVITPVILPPLGSLGPTTRALLAAPDVFTTPVLIPAGGGTTNWSSNPRAEGAITGTNTLPTGWVVTSNQTGVTVVGQGIDTSTGQSLPYVDLRFNYTTTSTQNFINLGIAPSITGDLWTRSAYVALVDGSLGGVSFALIHAGYASNGAWVSTAAGGVFIPTATLQRFAFSVATSAGATIRTLQYLLQWTTTNGAAIDFTLRIACPQLERGSVVTPLILPPAGSPGITTRALIAAPTALLPAQSRIDGQGGVSVDATVGNFASIGGSGSVRASARIIAGAAATIGGNGTARASGRVLAIDGAIIAGAGNVRVNATPLRPSGAVIDGEGDVAASPVVRAAASARIDGEGGYTAPPTRNSVAAARIGGVGSVVGDPNRTAQNRVGAALITGTGSFSSKAGLLLPVRALIAGTGSITDQSGTFAQVAARIDGEGNIIAAPLLAGQQAGASLIAGVGNVQAPGPFIRFAGAFATLAGVGTIIAQPTTMASTGARPTGEGTVIANPGVMKFTAAVIAGTGSVSAVHKSLLPQRPGAALIAGEGGQVVVTIVRRAVQAATMIAGMGSFSIKVPAIRSPAAAAIAGSGSVSAHADPQRPGAVRIGGNGHVAASAIVRVAGRARIGGLAAVAAYAMRLVPASARILGRGTVADDADAVLRARGRMTGTGAVHATAQAERSAHAVIHGAGHVRASAFKVASVHAAAAIHGAGHVGASVVKGPAHAPAAATIHGRSFVRASASQHAQVHASATIHGVGRVRSAARVHATAGATISAQGSVRARTRVLRFAHAIIHGLAALRAAAIKAPYPVSARIGGHGSVQAIAHVLAHGRARIDGRGARQAVAHVLARARSRIAGLGRVRYRPSSALAVRALLIGDGDVSANPTARLRVHAEARIDGAGLIKTDPYTPRERVAILGVVLPPTPRGVHMLPQPASEDELV